MPSLDAALPDDARVEHDTVVLSSMYYDTADHALLRSGVTLRRRTGDVDSGWQLKMPDGVARTEVRVPSGRPGRTVPRELQKLLGGIRHGGTLELVAKIDTERHRTRILDAEGTLQVEVADDHVSAVATGDEAEVTTWREVEVELGAATEKLLRRIGRTLRSAGAAAGAGPSKLARALDGGVPLPTAHSAAPASVGDTVRTYLDAQFAALVSGDLDLRHGDAPIHRTRVASRRYRSVLRVFADLFDPVRAAALDEELAWYAGLLGAVRDREVLRAHFDEAVHALPAELVLGPVAATIDEQLVAEQAEARRRLDQQMRSPRYYALMAELQAWHDRAPYTPRAARPADAVEKYLHKTQRTLHKRLAAVRADPSDHERVHRARKAGKRARYVGELGEPVLGKGTRRYVKRATAMQDVLGTHQDSVLAREVLRRIGAAAGTRPDENGFTFGLLYAHEQQRAEESRKRALKALQKL